MADKSFRVPPKLPKPVRTPERKTTSWVEPLFFTGGTPLASLVGAIWLERRGEGSGSERNCYGLRHFARRRLAANVRRAGAVREGAAHCLLDLAGCRGGAQLLQHQRA